MSNTTRTSPKRTTRRPVFVDLYVEEMNDGCPELNLIARFRGRRAAQKALDQPEFLMDLARSGGTLYMTTIAGKSPEVAKELPCDADRGKELRCWWKGYTKITSDGSPLVLWSLVWPRRDALEELLDLIIEV